MSSREGLGRPGWDEVQMHLQRGSKDGKRRGAVALNPGLIAPQNPGLGKVSLAHTALCLCLHGISTIVHLGLFKF